MRPFFLLPLCLLLSLTGFAQTIKGRVKDGKTGEALPFVNIGVVGKALGTVSSEQGTFELAFQDKLANDTVRVSALGYGTRHLTLRQLSQQPELALLPAPVALDEVQVSAKNLFRRSRTLGYSGTGVGTLELDAKDLGAQMGTVIYLRHKPTKILTANFTVARNLVGKLTFRLNLYRLDAKGRPTEEKLLSRDILVTTDITKGPLTFDLTSEKLILDEDFFLSLEWVGGTADAAAVHRGLAFAVSLGYANNDIYIRQVSQDKWERISAGAALAGMQPKLSFYVTAQD